MINPIKRPAETVPSIKEALKAELDRAADELSSSIPVAPALNSLTASLHEHRQQLSIEDWQDLIRTTSVSHRTRSLVHQSPLASRAFLKPRGYAGDAVVLDYIYGLTDVPPETTALGRAICQWERDVSMSASVRDRRRRLAVAIDAISETRRNARVLSVACGHLREGHLSRALAEGRLGAFIALDQDATSLETVAREQPAVAIVKGSARQLVTDQIGWTELDLVYSAGLYDYLSPRFATVLTAKLFGMLRSGGRLLIANMSPSVPEKAYAEMFLDWWMVYRTEDEIRSLASTIPPCDVACRQAFCDPSDNVAYLELARA